MVELSAKVLRNGTASLVSVDRQKFTVCFLDKTCCSSEHFSSFPKQINHLFSSSRIQGKLQCGNCAVGIQVLGLFLASGYVKGNNVATHLFICHWKCPVLPHKVLVEYPDVCLLHLQAQPLCFLVNMSDDPLLLVTDRDYSFCLKMTTGIIEIPRNTFSHLYFNLCIGNKTQWQSFELDSSLHSFFKVQSSI